MKQLNSNNPKILFWDLETCGVNALRADLGFVVCFGYKWLGDKKAKCLTIDERGLRRFDDKRLLKQASVLLNEADLTVAHFGSVFDRRFFQGRLMVNRLPPIAPTKMRDTKFMASAAANFSSNRLKNLAVTLDLVNQKMEKGRDDICPWPDTWFKVMQGNMRALQNMARYCAQDVEALEELYLRLRVFDKNHERLFEDRSKCEVCGGSVQYRGYAIQLSRRYRRYQCVACGHWGRETNALKQKGDK